MCPYVVVHLVNFAYKFVFASPLIASMSYWDILGDMRYVAVQLLLFFVECCIQDLFIIVHGILVWFLASFFFKLFFRVQVVRPHKSIDIGNTLNPIP